MSQGVGITFTTQVQGRYTGGNALVGAVADNLDFLRSITFQSGSGVDGADLLYTQEINLAASTNEVLALTSLVDPLGNSIDFARVKAIVVLADATNANDIVIGGAGSNPFVGPFAAGANALHTKPGGMTMLVTPDAAGWVVTPVTAMNLEVANSGAGSAVTGQLLILGAAE